MFLAFAMVFLLVTLFSKRWKGLRKRQWVAVAVLACLISLFLAWVSVSSAWTPDPMSYELKLGETEGVFPWAKLSYPLYLSVYHSNTTWIDTVSYGQVHVNVLFVNAKIIGANGTFLVYQGEVFRLLAPVYYHFDFIFSNPDAFFDFLFVLLALFNIIGALLGIALARMTLGRRKKKIVKSG